MLQLEELKLALNDLSVPLKDLSEAIGLSKINEEVRTLEKKSSDSEFWNDIDNSHKILQKISFLKNKQQKYLKLLSLYDDTKVLIDLALEEHD